MSPNGATSNGSSNGLNGTTALKSSTKPINPKSALDTISQFSIGIYFVKLLVLLFDIVTFPYFYFTQEPWKILAENNRERAVLEDPRDPYSTYNRVGTPYQDHYAFKAETIPEAQQLTLKMNQADLPCLGYRDIIQVQMEVQRNGKKLKKYKLTDYKWLSIEKTDQCIGNLAKGFVHHGVKFQEHVLIFAETRMEWFLCAQALWRIGSAVCTLYATLGLEGIVFAINETEVEHIVTTQDLLPNLLKVIDRMPKVRKIYVIEINSGLLNGAPVSEDQFRGKIPDREFSLVTYRKLMELGESIDDNDESMAYTRPKPDDIAVILYTSGSTGNPKGVILMHRNFMSAIHSVYSLLNQELLDTAENQTYFGYLPLAHSLEITAELVALCGGIKIGYGSPFTMTDNGTAIVKGQRGDIKLLQPTIMAGVPLILDRIRKMITDRFEKRSTFWKQLFKYSCAYKNFWLDHGYDTPLVNRLICARVKSQLGGRLQYMLIGGAPLSPDTQRVMRAFLNIKLLIGYGSTETCGASAITDLEDISIGMIGAPLHGVKLRLLDWPEGGYFATDKPNPRGELVLGGAAISRGYYKLPEQTAESYEMKNGEWWFKMGDIGEIFPNGTLKIIDRKKDLVKLQFGEYVSLGKVEAEYKNCKYVENICVYGDSMRTYMIAFLQPVMPAIRHLATELKKPTDLTAQQLCDDPEIIEAVTTELRQFGQESGLNKMEIPQKIKLCPDDWSPTTGLLTASMKINRKNIQKCYEDDIERLYS